MHEMLRLEGVTITKEYFCPHHPEEAEGKYKIDCDCRKPNIGLLKRAQDEYDIDLSHSWTIGDKPSDIQAGITAGTRTIGILSRESSPIDLAKAGAEKIFDNILEATEYISLQS